MGRGSYFGGSLILRGEGIQLSPRGNRHGRITSTGPEHERQKLLKREQDQEARTRIKANEKLLKKLAMEWRQANGRKLVEKPTINHGARPRVVAPAEAKNAIAGKTLGQALQEAFSKRNGGGQNR